MALALMEQIEERRRGPQAVWAPPPLALGLSPAQSPDILVVGAPLPWQLQGQLLAHGHRIEAVGTLCEARERLCRHRYRCLITEPTAPDADMVAFSVALKAGHADASHVPQRVQSLPVLLLEGSEAVCLLADGHPVEVDEGGLAAFVLDLLR